MELRKVKKVFIRMTMIFLSVAVGIALFEAVIRILVPQPLEFHSVEKIMVSTPEKMPTTKLIPNSQAYHYGVLNKINSLGMRDREIRAQKPDDIIRIAFLGDSITYGLGVRLEDTFPKVVEDILNKQSQTDRYESINGGVIGYNFANELAFLKQDILKLKPDIVLICITLNDTVDEFKNVVRKRAHLNFLYVINRFLREKSHLYFFLQDRGKRMLHHYGKLKPMDIKVQDFLEGNFSERDYHRISHTLSEMKNLASSHGYKFATVIFPFEMQLDQERLDRISALLNVRFKPSILDGAPQALIRRFSRGMNIPVLDLLPAFKAKKNNDLFVSSSINIDWFHLNPSGHRLAAQEIAEFITEEVMD
jgi:lysophospholipase L1-like esterase